MSSNRIRTAVRATVAGVATVGAFTAAGAAGPAMASSAPASVAVSVPAPPRVPADCSTLLAAYREVSRDAGLVIGADGLPWRSPTSPAVWARVLRRAGDPDLARVAAAVRGPGSGDQFVMALTEGAADAVEAQMAGGWAGVCSVRGDVARRGPAARQLPGFVHWAFGPGRSVIVWGGPPRTVGGASCIVRRNGTAGPS